MQVGVAWATARIVAPRRRHGRRSPGKVGLTRIMRILPLRPRDRFMVRRLPGRAAMECVHCTDHLHLLEILNVAVNHHHAPQGGLPVARRQILAHGAIARDAAEELARCPAYPWTRILPRIRLVPLRPLSRAGTAADGRVKHALLKGSTRHLGGGANAARGARANRRRHRLRVLVHARHLLIR